MWIGDEWYGCPSCRGTALRRDGLAVDDRVVFEFYDRRHTLISSCAPRLPPGEPVVSKGCRCADCHHEYRADAWVRVYSDRDAAEDAEKEEVVDA